MKLVILTSIREYEKEIKHVLKECGVSTYSFSHVIGFRDLSMEAIERNWFATEMNENESIMFYAFTTEEKALQISTLIREFNEKSEVLSRIHFAIVKIENSK